MLKYAYACLNIWFYSKRSTSFRPSSHPISYEWWLLISRNLSYWICFFITIFIWKTVQVYRISLWISWWKMMRNDGPCEIRRQSDSFTQAMFWAKQTWTSQWAASRYSEDQDDKCSSFFFLCAVSSILFLKIRRHYTVTGWKLLKHDSSHGIFPHFHPSLINLCKAVISEGENSPLLSPGLLAWFLDWAALIIPILIFTSQAIIVIINRTKNDYF